MRRRDHGYAPDERTPYPDRHDGVYAIMAETLQIIGAILVLAGFAGAQLGWVGAASVSYLTVNAVGAALLAILALLDGAWGFLLLEGVWTVVSVISLAGALRRSALRRSPLRSSALRRGVLHRRPRLRAVLDREHGDQQHDQEGDLGAGVGQTHRDRGERQDGADRAVAQPADP
jgi:hypothetical protein